MEKKATADIGFRKFHFNDLDKVVLASFTKWVKDDFSDIPLSELGLETCYEVKLQNGGALIIIHIYYDGSYTGTDPCFGHVTFSLQQNASRLLMNDIECAS
jgi:hypothetical protein